MCVAAEIFEHLLRAAEGRLRVHHPFGPAQWGQKGGERRAVPQIFKIAEEVEFAVFESLLERFQEQPSKQAGQDAHGKEESRQAGDPALVIGRKAAAGNDAVQMGMMLEILAPGMQDGEEA